MRYRILLILMCVLFFLQSGIADELQLQNGDRLTGKIIHLVDRKMVFNSEFAGEVTVDLSDIRTLSSDEPITVNLQDQTGFTQRVLSAEEGLFSVEGSDALGAQEFSVSDIISINPPIKPAPRWTGNISVGITSTHGNTKAESISASARVKKRTEKDRTTASADYAKVKQEDETTGEDETIEDWWRAKGKYDYFFSQKMYGYLDVRYEKDSVAELDRRVTVGIGSGYQWIESDDMNFSTEIGVASLYEKFDNQTDSNSEISAQLGYNFDTKIRENITFMHDLTYYPSLDKFSDYYLTTTAELRADLTEAFFANFKTILNYDATPAIGAHKTDIKYFFGLGYSF